MTGEWGIPRPDERLMAERLGISVTTLRQRLLWGERVERVEPLHHPDDHHTQRYRRGYNALLRLIRTGHDDGDRLKGRDDWIHVLRPDALDPEVLASIATQDTECPS